jgi:hypothetical protein
LIFDFYIRFDHHFLIVKYLVLNPLLIFFFNFIPWHLIFISNFILILLIVIFIFSYLSINWNCFSITSLMIWFYLLFVSNLILIIFRSIFFFPFYPFLNLFFMFIPNYFGWLWILYCYFLGLPFILWFGLMIHVTSFEGWIGLASIIFNYVFIPQHLISFDFLSSFDPYFF